MAGIVWDLGNVLIDWDPRAAVAAGLGEAEAGRFFDGFDFGAWNHACDAGLPWTEALAELEREHPKWFPFLGLLDDVVVSGAEGIAKPDPAIYHVAAERCGLPLTSLAFVDDKPANVAAAETLGLHGLVFTDDERLRSGLRALGLPA